MSHPVYCTQLTKLFSTPLNSVGIIGPTNVFRWLFAAEADTNSPRFIVGHGLVVVRYPCTAAHTAHTSTNAHALALAHAHTRASGKYTAKNGAPLSLSFSLARYLPQANTLTRNYAVKRNGNC